LQIVYALNLVGQSVSEMEMNIVSTERVLEYTDLDSEVYRRQMLLKVVNKKIVNYYNNIS